MRVVWAPEALLDRIEIWDYIATDNPAAAERMDGLFSDSANRLADHPKLGRSFGYLIPATIWQGYW